MITNLDISKIHSGSNKYKNESSFLNPNLKTITGNKSTKFNLPGVIKNIVLFNKLDSSINLSDFTKSNRTKKLIPDEDYDLMIGDSMLLYQTEQTITDKVDDKLENFKKEYLFNNSLSRTLNYGASEESTIKIFIANKDYKSPFECSVILKKNRKVFDEVSQNFMDRQESLYADAIDKFDQHTMKFKTKMPKIKITSLMPRNNIEIPKICMDLSEELNKLKNELDKPPSSPDKKNKAVKKMSIRLNEDNIPIYDARPKLFAYYKYPNKNFPECREQFAFCYNLVDMVLWGGIASNKINNIWTLNPVTLEWFKHKGENYPANPRYAHTGVQYQMKFYIFGGKSKMQNYTFLADLEVYDMETGLWSTPIVYTKSTLPLRKNHIAETVGHQMLIHGGISETNEYLNDTYLLNYTPLKWHHCQISEDVIGPTLAGHCSALVLPYDIKSNPKFNIYKYPEVSTGKFNNSRIKEKGLYLFGGKTKEENGLTNELWILKLGKKPLEWSLADTKGQAPPARYAHSMNYYEEGNFLMVHGGRNDQTSDSFALSDTFVFDLHKFEWHEIKLQSDLNNFQVFARCGHGALIYSIYYNLIFLANKLLIFGGMNSLNYIGSTLFIINLDFYTHPVKQTEEERKYEVLQKNIKELGLESYKKMDKMKKHVLRRQISTIDELVLPLIK